MLAVMPNALVAFRRHTSPLDAMCRTALHCVVNGSHAFDTFDGTYLVAGAPGSRGEGGIRCDSALDPPFFVLVSTVPQQLHRASPTCNRRTSMQFSSHSLCSRQLPLFTALVATSILAACGTSTRSSADSTLAVRTDSSPSAAMRADSAGAMSRSAHPSTEQQAVLDQLGTMGGKPIETLSAAEARKQPTPTDAVMALLKKDGKLITPEAVGNVVNRTIPGPGGALPVRIYTPQGTGPFPVIVYFHGGGFVIATNDTYDGSARALTNAASAVVVSVEYRKAPEHKFPAAHDDAYAAYTWVLANAASLKGDAKRVALAGESAGGNLALATAMAARDKGVTLPIHILAVYPVAGNDTNTVSYRENATAKPLNRPMMSWFFEKYTRTPADAQDPRLNILGANLKGLPPTTIVTAELDPLRTDSELLAARLRAAGVQVQQKTYAGMAHEFFGQGAVVPMAKEAVQYAADGLKSGFQATTR